MRLLPCFLVESQVSVQSFGPARHLFFCLLPLIAKSASPVYTGTRVRYCARTRERSLGRSTVRLLGLPRLDEVPVDRDVDDLTLNEVSPIALICKRDGFDARNL